MDERDREGMAATLRAAAWIVIAGIGLGLAFNAVGLASRPPRGLSWIRHPERLPSLEELQPASGLVPVTRPRAFAGLALVGTAWAGGVPTRSVGPSPRIAASDTARATAKPTAGSAKAAAKTTKAPVQPAKNKTQPVKPAIVKTNAPAPAATPARADLPVVPDLDQPIEVKLPNVKKFFDAGPAAAVIVDAREAVEYAAGHIAGARCVPYDDAVAKPELLAPFKGLGRPIIVYCSGGDCESSKDLAKSMLAEGIRKVLVFTDGYPAWQAAGYPVEKGVAGAKR
jgi:rhodanese-related sulfurtransferase